MSRQEFDNSYNGEEFVEKCCLLDHESYQFIIRWLPSTSLTIRERGFVEAARCGNIQILKLLYYVISRNYTGAQLKRWIETTPDIAAACVVERSRSLWCHSS